MAHARESLPSCWPWGAAPHRGLATSPSSIMSEIEIPNDEPWQARETRPSFHNLILILITRHTSFNISGHSSPQLEIVHSLDQNGFSQGYTHLAEESEWYQHSVHVTHLRYSPILPARPLPRRKPKQDHGCMSWFAINQRLSVFQGAASSRSPQAVKFESIATACVTASEPSTTHQLKDFHSLIVLVYLVAPPSRPWGSCMLPTAIPGANEIQIQNDVESTLSFGGDLK